MKVLCLSRWAPYPADNGAKIRIFNIIRVLARRHDLSLLAFGGGGSTATADQIDGVRPYCSHVELVPYRVFRPGQFKAVAGLFSPQPRSMVDTYSQHMRSRSEEHTSELQSRVDLVCRLLLEKKKNKSSSDTNALHKHTTIETYRHACQPGEQ